MWLSIKVSDVCSAIKWKMKRSMEHWNGGKIPVVKAWSLLVKQWNSALWTAVSPACVSPPALLLGGYGEPVSYQYQSSINHKYKYQNKLRYS